MRDLPGFFDSSDHSWLETGSPACCMHAEAGAGGASADMTEQVSSDLRTSCMPNAPNPESAIWEAIRRYGIAERFAARRGC
jgi:hypothetical protein